MELITKVDISRKLMKLSHDDGMVLIGSCFADNIGAKLQEAHFDCCVNPFGTLYNPLSVTEALSESIRGRRYATSDQEVFEADGVWHSWMHHSRFSAATAEELVANINTAIEEAHEALRKCRLLIITLGTAYVYRMASTGRVVANCHKQSEILFHRNRLTVSEVKESLHTLIQQLTELNPDVKVMFTVSPIRHKRDGYHANQLSKSTLLLAVDELCAAMPDTCMYFPAYEIMMDELRDYRFYADDMVHPSSLAVEYIWERFTDAFFDRTTKEEAERWRKINKRKEHKKIVRSEVQNQ